MESSRIFIKGLPPTISEEEFRKHFSSKQAITDAKLIPHRRIGYVGYKTPEDAQKAVKYFNKSFIRMSKIGVEMARAISDTTLPPSRKVQRETERQAQQERAERAAAKAAAIADIPSLKRKRAEVDAADPKLQEFLEVMQPGSKSKAWTSKDGIEEPPTKVQAIELPEEESDEEYEMVPKKARNASREPSPAKVAAPPVVTPMAEVVDATELADDIPAIGAAETQPAVGLDATDDDWLRSHTSRLLDLVKPEDMVVDETAPAASTVVQSTQTAEPSASTADVAMEDVEELISDSVEATKEVVGSTDATMDAIRESGRLFVRNLPYTATEDELRVHFEKYGALEEIHLPLDASGASKGFVLVQYEDHAAAAEAFHNVDGEPFQGRLLHILPAAAKRDKKLDEFEIAKLPLKKQRLIKKKAEATSSAFNWNSLYMNQDAVNSSIADRLGVSKSELLDPTSADAGVKQAIAETSVIQETKAYFANNNVDLNAFKKRERGDTTILVKNFTYGTSIDEIRKMFEEFGSVIRVLMPPSATIAIVEFSQAPQARAAFASLAYRRMKDSVIYLEKAPKDLFTQAASVEIKNVTNDAKSTSIDAKLSVSDLLGPESAQTGADTSTLFVRNLSFNTTSDRLTETFKPLDGFMSARVNTKTDPKKPGQVLSMGFGFLEFRSKAQAQAALKVMDGHSLDGHNLTIKASHRGVDAAEERRKEERAKKMAGKRTKIIVKNLPFEASKKDIRTLFGTYGQLRSVRVPKKFDNTARGFAFAEFVTAREAENAIEALKDTHLLGRRLVIEFAAEDAVDAEEEIEKMQKKVGKQVNKVALQNLTGGGRKRFNVDDGAAED
ncbi:Multiple RNA-binding domain-containing protein 1 [Pseudogymnoascus australis]